MYSWNELKISVEGDNNNFIDGIKKYINAVYEHEYEGECDIKTTVCTKSSCTVPEVPAGARHVKSVVFDMNGEFRLDVYSKGTHLWYIYRNNASIWIDYSTNELIVCVDGMPIDFEYYNILIFFLHPLGTLLENFGYFRMHSSCVGIGGKALLITGVSGSGKSTAAFCVPGHNGQIIADDLTFINKDDNGYHPSSLSGLVKLRDDSIKRFFPELNRIHSAAHYENETYFFLADINEKRSYDLDLHGITILEQTGKKSSSYSTAHPSEIVPQLFPSTIHTNIEENTGRKFIFITDMLNDIKTYKIKFGTEMSAFNTVINELLKKESE